MAVIRMIVQFSVPVNDVKSGEDFYRRMKDEIQQFSDKATISGSLSSMLEPCCGGKASPHVPAINRQIA